MRREAVEHGDVVVLPLVTEHYNNITHQTLEIVRMAAADPEVTHVLKVCAQARVALQESGEWSMQVQHRAGAGV